MASLTLLAIIHIFTQCSKLIFNRGVASTEMYFKEIEGADGREGTASTAHNVGKQGIIIKIHKSLCPLYILYLQCSEIVRIIFGEWNKS